MATKYQIVKGLGMTNPLPSTTSLLVSMLGADVAWVQNVKAASGGPFCATVVPNRCGLRSSRSRSGRAC
jgi:hypothetical protein